jgi:hypothetical protein
VECGCQCGRRVPLTTDNDLNPGAVNEIIRGPHPVDWTQLRLPADRTPAERSSTCTMIAQSRSGRWNLPGFGACLCTSRPSADTVPKAASDACRSCGPDEPLPAGSAPVEEPTGPLSERIKASVTVLESISQYVDLQPTANGALGRCPFHDDHHPSFGVNDEGNYWHCFAGCGGGSAIDFWMKWRGCDSSPPLRTPCWRRWVTRPS